MYDWARKWEGDFSAVVASDRAKFQALFMQNPAQRPLGTASTLRTFLNQKADYRSLVVDVYQRETGVSLTDAGYASLIAEPAWALYFLGYAHAFHHRAIKEQEFSERRNAGAIDLGRAVYLTLCDRFVTRDGPQFKALRLLNVFNTKRRTEILTYAAFRSRLLAFD